MHSLEGVAGLTAGGAIPAIKQKTRPALRLPRPTRHRMACKNAGRDRLKRHLLKLFGLLRPVTVVLATALVLQFLLGVTIRGFAIFLRRPR